MNVVKLTIPTRDEILDGYVEIIQSEQRKGMLAFYEIAKTLKLAQNEFGGELGSNQHKLKREDVQICTSKYSSFSDFCKKVGYVRERALEAIQIIDMIGFDADFTKVISAKDALYRLSTSSKEIQEELLPKILKGEKIRSNDINAISKAKEALKALPKAQREVISQASYELDEEERTDMTFEEIQDSHARADSFIANELPSIKQNAKENRKATYQEGLDKLDEYVNETKEVQEWLFAIIKQIPLDKQPAVSKKALYSTFNICYDGACAETEVVNFIETNINTY